MDDLFEKLLNETPGDTKRFVSKSMDVSDQIVELLKIKGISQKQLADMLGKNESEVSRWLVGNHNFTLRTLAKIEDILKEDILIAPMYLNDYEGSFAPSLDLSFQERSDKSVHALKPGIHLAGRYNSLRTNLDKRHQPNKESSPKIRIAS